MALRVAAAARAARYTTGSENRNERSSEAKPRATHAGEHYAS
jgi:hypothetical protein